MKMGRRFRRPRLLTKCGVQGDHPPAGVWGRAPKPYAAAFFVSVASVRRTQETRLFPKPGVFQRSGAAVSPPLLRAKKRSAWGGSVGAMRLQLRGRLLSPAKGLLDNEKFRLSESEGRKGRDGLSARARRPRRTGPRYPGRYGCRWWCRCC